MGFHATAVLGIFIGIATLILSWVVPNIIVRRKEASDNTAVSEY